MKITERGWAGHFICANRCNFRRNTLIEHNEESVVVSTVGNMVVDNIIEKIGADRYFETMVFHADTTKWKDANVRLEISIDSNWCIDQPWKEDLANEMHEEIVKEIENKLLNNKLNNG